MTAIKELTVREFVEVVVTELVDHPADVKVEAINGDAATMIEVRVHPNDTGKIIGRQGSTILALRKLVSCLSAKEKHRYTVNIIE